MAEWGLSETSICQLLRLFPPGKKCRCVQCHGEPCTRIERQLQRMPSRLDHASRCGTPVRKPDALLYTAIGDDFGWPKGVQPRQWQVDHAEKQLHALDAPPSKSAAELRKEAEPSREKLLAYFESLSAIERETIQAQAAELTQKLTGKNTVLQGGLMLMGAIQKHHVAKFGVSL